MTKLFKVLILLVVFLGLGISCASAANVAVSFNPQTVELQPGSSQNVQVVMNQVPANGLSGFNITVSVADPTITNITAVSAPGWAGISGTSTVPANFVWITAVDTNGKVHAGDTNVSFGNITITGIKAGTTNLSIVPTEIDDSIGNLINPDVTMCQVNVISVLPVANFTSNVTSGSAPLIVQFNDTSLNETLGRTWTFGDGSPSTTDANPIHIFNNAGTFTVDLTASNANGTNNTSKTITVNPPPKPVLPVANFTSNVTSGFAPLTVQFNDTSLNETLGRTWTFGDGSPSTTDANPIHIFNNAGTFTVNLTASNANGTNYTSKTITVNPPPKPVLPVANFTSNVTSGFAPLTVQFNDTSLNETLGRTWTFGDGSPSTTNANPIHTYNNAGTFVVNLTAINENGTNITSKTITVNVSKATPSITWSNPANITYGTAVSSTQLNAIASVPGNFVYTPASGTVLSAGTQTLHADFTPTDEANYTKTSADVTINISKATSTLTWSNPANITYGTALSSTQLNATASVPGNFIYSPASGTIQAAGIHTLTTTFTPTDSTNYTTAIASVQINVIKAIPVISWSNPANIAYGTALSSVQLNALSPTTGTFVYNPSSGTVLGAGSRTLNTQFTPTDGTNYTTATASVTLNVTMVTPVITWSNPADITDETPLSSTQLDATASVPGTFVYNPPIGTVLNAGTQTLHADFTPDDVANYTTASKDVTINVTSQPPVVLPTAIIGANTTDGVAPLTVQFNDTSLDETLGRTWTFGDGSPSTTDANPIHIFNNPGTFVVNLTATNENGTNNTSKTITVNPVPPTPQSLKINDFKADITSGYEPLKVNFTSDVSGSPTRWTWKFSRFSTQSFKAGTATHTFLQDGVYDVTLTVRDAKGHTNSMTKKAYITVLKVPAPKASFTADVTSGKAPLTVQFNDMSTNNPTSWLWSFGDGHTSRLQNPSHTYTRAGKYTVTLSVKNAGGSDYKVIRNEIIVTPQRRNGR